MSSAIVSIVSVLDKLEGAVSMEETTVCADGDSDLAVGTAHGCCSVSGLGIAYELILPVLWMKELDDGFSAYLMD
jgi:hypothetical protein